MNTPTKRIKFIDSHTAGEPTRVIVEGGPDLGSGPLSDRRERLRSIADSFRRCVIHEPRGHDAVVGALLGEPSDDSFSAGVIFFNNTGYLGMCGHGTIGVAVTLYYMGRTELGPLRLETPVGVVDATLLSPHRVSVTNVPSYRLQANVTVEVDGLGTVTGDVAWGGNWFFLVDGAPAPLTLEHADALSHAAHKVRASLWRAGITGANGAEIDHIEFFGPPHTAEANGRNFVYCPGGAFDRSPCGTGTSAKLACLAADGKLRAGETWVQESLIGSTFEASYTRLDDTRVLPTIIGEAFICAEGSLIQQPRDPFAFGIGGKST